MRFTCLSLRAMRLEVAGLAVLAAAGCATAPSFTIGARTVQIQRTAHHVAHVTAGDLESLTFGVAYANAQDNVCQTADHLVTMRGERSRWFGATAMATLGLRPMPNEQIDIFVRAHMDDAVLANADAASSEDARALARGWVAGYNRYLADHAGRLPAPCGGQPWVVPMTLADYRRMTEMTSIQLGVGLQAAGVVTARPPQAQTELHPRGQPASIDAIALADELDRDRMHAGSNGWAFGGDVTANGRGLVVANPHFPWSGVNRFWQAHLTIPGRLDVMGVTIGHSPLVVIGFNRDIAWTHTVSTAKRYTLHELRLVPGDSTSYLVDGKPERMRSKVVRYDVRGDDGRLVTRETTLWSSRHGPVFVLPRAGLQWTATTAYALKDAAASNARFADAWLALDQARNIADVRAAVAGLGIPWVNTIAADRHGDALYVDGSIVPDVDAALLARCAPSKPAADLFRTAGLVVLDGSRSDCDWHRDPRSPVPGLTPIERLPMLARRDYVQNANDSYWLANPSAPLTGFSPVIGAIDVPQNPRTRAGLDALRTLLGSSPGTAKKIDLADVERTLLDNRNYVATIVLDDLMVVCADALATRPAIVEACTVLKAWDRRNDVDSRGAHLFREWANAAARTPGIWSVAFNPADPVGTPSGLNIASVEVRVRVLEALERASAAVRNAGFALDAPLGQVQAQTVRGIRIPVHGGTTDEGVLNVIESGGLTRDGYVTTTGTSYLQAVTFDADGPIADGLLTYGQSSNSASPYAFDQLETFARKRWLPLPFRPSEIASMKLGDPLVLTVD